MNNTIDDKDNDIEQNKRHKKCNIGTSGSSSHGSSSHSHRSGDNGNMTSSPSTDVSGPGSGPADAAEGGTGTAPSGLRRQKQQQRQNPQHKRISHVLSWVLRHSAQDIGLSIRPDGYVPVHEIINSNHPKLKKVFGGGIDGKISDSGAASSTYTTATTTGISGISRSIINDIRAIVESNDKQRFKLAYRPMRLYYNDDKDDSLDEAMTMILCIRANQGHSMTCIDAESLLTRLTSDQILNSDDLVPCIVHGTYEDKWHNHIRTEGLHRMTRNHIHFATGVNNSGDGDGDNDGNNNVVNVISGIRQSCTVYIYLDKHKCAAAARNSEMISMTMMKDDNGNIAKLRTHGNGNGGLDDDKLDLYISDNGVILTDGINGTGVIPPEYFAYVTHRSGKMLLDQRE
jgi:2'-phosphotransferase